MTTWRLGPYAGLDWRFVVEGAGRLLHDEVQRVLSPLAAERSGPASTYRLLPGTRGAVLVDGEEIGRARSDARLLQHLIWHVNQGTFRNSPRYVLLHAAAAARGDRAVILCAPQEAGKTTLVAGLVLAGLDYLTDETVALDPETHDLVPYPKALSVDQGSWPYLSGLRPRVSPEAQALSPLQWQVVPTDVRPDSVSTGARPHALVLPQYRPGAETILREVSPGEAMLDVLQQTFLLDRQRERDMRSLGRLLSALPCYRLTTGDLDTAVRLVVDELVA